MIEEKWSFKWWSLRSVKYCWIARDDEDWEKIIVFKCDKVFVDPLFLYNGGIPRRLQIEERNWGLRTGRIDILPFTIVVLYPRERDNILSYLLTLSGLESLNLQFSTHFVFVSLSLLSYASSPWFSWTLLVVDEVVYI